MVQNPQVRFKIATRERVLLTIYELIFFNFGLLLLAFRLGVLFARMPSGGDFRAYFWGVEIMQYWYFYVFGLVFVTLIIAVKVSQIYEEREGERKQREEWAKFIETQSSINNKLDTIAEGIRYLISKQP